MPFRTRDPLLSRMNNAGFNCLKFPDKVQALERIRDLTCLADILPTRFHGAVTAKVGVGSTVYVARVGPVGLAAADAACILGAAVVRRHEPGALRACRE